MKFMLIAFLMLTQVLWGATDLQISGSREQVLKVSIHDVASAGLHPCLIIAPGSGYHKELPIITSLAQEAANSGIVAIRFDWEYTNTQGSASPDIMQEQQDLRDVIAYARSRSDVDTTHIYLAGKSLGSVVAWRVFTQDEMLAGILLLTPVLATTGMGERYYPRLKEGMRSVGIVVGGEDSDNCPLDVLYDFLADTSHTVPVVVVPGDHGLNLGQWDDPAYFDVNAGNINAAIKSAVMWLRRWIR